MSDRKCVVCSAPAKVFCQNDNAYLCELCDVTVHQAHPLAASHVRVPIGNQDRDDSVDPFFEIPTVPDAFCDPKDPTEAKADEVSHRPLRVRDEVIC